MAAMRARVVATVPASTLSFMPGSRVWIRPTRLARKGATRTSGPPLSATFFAAATAPGGAANGMILIVATICRGSTRA
jgi:hypothetical protein